MRFVLICATFIFSPYVFSDQCTRSVTAYLDHLAALRFDLTISYSEKQELEAKMHQVLKMRETMEDCEVRKVILGNIKIIKQEG